MTSRELTNEVVGQLAAIVGALTDAPVVAAPADARPAAGYLVTLAPHAGGQWTLHVHVDANGAEALMRATGVSGEPSETAVTSALRDLFARTAEALMASDDADARLEVAAVVPAAQPYDVSLVLLQLVQGDRVIAQIAIGESTANSARDAAAPAETPARAGSRPAGASTASAPAQSNLETILDMELPLVVRFGRTEMTLKTLAEIAPGTVIDLGRAPDDPVEILVSNQVVARAEVVTVGGAYGVRIIDVISHDARARYMENMA